MAGGGVLQQAAGVDVGFADRLAAVGLVGGIGIVRIAGIAGGVGVVRTVGILRCLAVVRRLHVRHRIGVGFVLLADARHHQHHRGDQHGQPDVHAGVAPEHADDDARQADDRGRLDVDAAGDHHQRDEQGDDADADVVDDAVHDGLGPEELGVGRAEDHELQHQEHQQEDLPVLKDLFQQIFHFAAPPSGVCSAVLERRRFLLAISTDRR